MLLKYPNEELLVAVGHNRLRTMASETVDSIDGSHSPPSWAVNPECLAHSINRCSLCRESTQQPSACEATTLTMRPLRGCLCYLMVQLLFIQLFSSSCCVYVIQYQLLAAVIKLQLLCCYYLAALSFLLFFSYHFICCCYLVAVILQLLFTGSWSAAVIQYGVQPWPIDDLQPLCVYYLMHPLNGAMPWTCVPARVTRGVLVDLRQPVNASSPQKLSVQQDLCGTLFVYGTLSFTMPRS